MCSMLPYSTDICCYAFIYFFFIIVSVHSFFILVFVSLNLVLINQWNGPWYQHVLALCVFLAGMMLKGLILRKFCVWCLCVFYVGLCRDWFCGFWIICSLMTCLQSKQETDWALFLALMWSSMADSAQNTNYLNCKAEFEAKTRSCKCSVVQKGTQRSFILLTALGTLLHLWLF